MSGQTRLVHHELCFGCGRTNLFGLLMDLEPTGEASVKGRGFIKQDHQGSEPGHAHEGIVVAALSEAMSLACGQGARPSRFEIDLKAPAPVGGFLDVEAEVVTLAEGICQATATARVEEQEVASATGWYYRR